MKSEACQDGDSEFSVSKHISALSSVYRTRKDVASLKNEIVSKIGDEGYWEALSRFIYGQISKDNYDSLMSDFLYTDELKILHNRLIREILYNAHYSMNPPSEEALKQVFTHSKPPTQSIQPIPEVKLEPVRYSSYQASGMKRIWSVETLLKKMKGVAGDKASNVTVEARCLLLNYLKSYLKSILACASETLPKGAVHTITVKQIFSVLEHNQCFIAAISPTVLTTKIPN